MIDITPLPSPQFLDDTLSPRRHPSLRDRSSRNSSLSQEYTALDPLPSRSNSLIAKRSPSRKKKTYSSLASAVPADQPTDPMITVQKHGRNRSVSDFVPEALCNIRQRVATFGSLALDSADVSANNQTVQPQMHREANLAARRGIAAPASAARSLPSPTTSSISVPDSEFDDDDESFFPLETGVEYFTVHSAAHRRIRQWRAVKQLGQGTFSRVILATNQRLAPGNPYDEKSLDPNRLVAIKVIEHGPAGGADEDRIKHSLSREVDILKTISHPSIVHLQALEETTERTFLVLTYCEGGDLFDFASRKRDALTPVLVQRVFAELVHAVRYLHRNWIVHRDIKLESMFPVFYYDFQHSCLIYPDVLVNVRTCLLDAPFTPSSHPSPIVILTDLGLSRRISPPPASPLLTTRCGSEDYAAPELLLGQPYDGRSTDAWALGVLLYALIEGRLPFDAPPGRPDRSRNTHRIARCDWIWCRFGDENGDWVDGAELTPTSNTTSDTSPMGTAGVNGTRYKGIQDWAGARICVEGLLRKLRTGRKSLDEIAEMEWVAQGLPGSVALNG